MPTPPKAIDPVPNDPQVKPQVIVYWNQRIDALMQRGSKKIEDGGGWDPNDGPLPWEKDTRVPPQVLRAKQAEIAVARNDSRGVPAG